MSPRECKGRTPSLGIRHCYLGSGNRGLDVQRARVADPDKDPKVCIHDDAILSLEVRLKRIRDLGGLQEEEAWTARTIQFGYLVLHPIGVQGKCVRVGELHLR